MIGKITGSPNCKYAAIGTGIALLVTSIALLILFRQELPAAFKKLSSYFANPSKAVQAAAIGTTIAVSALLLTASLLCCFRSKLISKTPQSLSNPNFINNY